MLKPKGLTPSEIQNQMAPTAPYVCINLAEYSCPKIPWKFNL